MSVPLNLIAAVSVDEMNSRRMARFTEQVAAALNALIAAGTLIQQGNNEWNIDPSSLPPSGVTAGSYTTATITVNAAGLLTAAATGAAYDRIQEDGSNLTQRRTLNFGTALTATDDAGNTRTNVVLANTAVTPNTYTNATVTVDQQGRITSAASGTASGISPLTTKGDIWGYSTVDARFPVAVGDGAVIIQDAAATFGFKWAAVSGDLTAAASGAFTIANDAVTYAKIQNVSAASRLIGRGSASGSGDAEEITVGSGLSMSGTSLITTGGGAGGGPTIVIKSADETISASTALQSDDELLFAIGANDVWAFEMVLFLNGSTVGDFKVALNVPSGCTGRYGVEGVVTGATTFSGDLAAVSVTDLTDTGVSAFGTNTTTDTMIVLKGTVTNSSNAGNVTLRWAQFSASGSTIIRAGSFIIAHRKS